MKIAPELLHKMPDGSFRVQHYDEFLKIMQLKDTTEAFEQWAKVAVTLTQTEGNA